MKNLITITATFTGEVQDLEMAEVYLANFSFRKRNFRTLKVSWICEEPNYEKALQNSMDCINLEALEGINVEMNHIS